MSRHNVQTLKESVQRFYDFVQKTLVILQGEISTGQDFDEFHQVNCVTFVLQVV